MPTAAEILAQVNAAFGEGAVTLGSDEALQVRYWSTGIAAIDYLLNGGLPTGRFLELYGDYSTLKSYIALKSIAAVQQAGGTAVLIDTEHAWDEEWGLKLGIKPDELLVQQPETAEQAVMLIETLVRAQYDLIVWDSIAASQPKQYAEAKPGEDNAPAALARVMSRGLARINSVNKKSCILALNQTRVNVGMTYGSAASTPGGKAMPFYASYRVRLVKAGKVTEEVKVFDGEKMVTGKKTVAVKIKAVVEKSKLSRPFSEVWMLYDLNASAVDDVSFVIGQGLEHGWVQQNGAMWSVDDLKVRGRKNFVKAVASDDLLMSRLKDRVLATSLIPRPDVGSGKAGEQAATESSSATDARPLRTASTTKRSSARSKKASN